MQLNILISIIPYANNTYGTQQALGKCLSMNIQAEDGWNEGLLESLYVKARPIVSKRIQSLQNSFLNKLPSANSLP